MALIGYFKAEPTEYILVYRNGRLAREGAGLTFFFWGPSTTIMRAPTATIDLPFALSETTSAFQPVTVQGQLTYRITAPRTLAELLNFSIDPHTRRYRSNDPERLAGRIVNVIQMYLRHELQQLALDEALRGSERLAGAVLARMQADSALASLGLTCLNLFVTAMKPTPETAKALEAEKREALQQRADQAIYARRAEAVEQERRIKQNEMSTAVDLEERRRQLVALQGENARREAEIEAEATGIRLAPFQQLDPRLVLALAFRDFASNADKIGQLTITSDILQDLLSSQRP